MWWYEKYPVLTGGPKDFSKEVTGELPSKEGESITKWAERGSERSIVIWGSGTDKSPGKTIARLKDWPTGQQRPVAAWRKRLVVAEHSRGHSLMVGERIYLYARSITNWRGKVVTVTVKMETGARRGAHAFNPSTQEAEAGRSLWVWSQLCPQSEFQVRQRYIMRTCQEKKKDENWYLALWVRGWSKLELKRNKNYLVDISPLSRALFQHVGWGKQFPPSQSSVSLSLKALACLVSEVASYSLSLRYVFWLSNKGERSRLPNRSLSRELQFNKQENQGEIAKMRRDRPFLGTTT